MVFVNIGCLVKLESSLKEGQITANDADLKFRPLYFSFSWLRNPEMLVSIWSKDGSESLTAK